VFTKARHWPLSQ